MRSCATLSDSFQQALADTLPVLQKIRVGFGPHPTATLATLVKLKAAGASRGGPARGGDGDPAAPSARAADVEDAGPPSFQALATLRQAALACVKCPHLVKSRTRVVFGVGNPNAELMFVGEAPGADEDEQGEPFVGEVGQLLTKIIQAMGFSREEIYLGNVLKCRPDMPPGESGKRQPKPEEITTCLPWLEKQIALIKPRALVALGATAVEGLLGHTEPVGKLRGRWLDFHGIPVMTTYHPAYLLRKESITEKRKVWEDMLLVLEKLEKPISEKQRQFFTKG